MTRKTASEVQPGKVTNGKRNADQLSQATIARRQKKVQIAEEKFQVLESTRRISRLYKTEMPKLM